MQQDTMEMDLARPRFFPFPVLFDEVEDYFMSAHQISGLSVFEDGQNVYIEVALPGVDPKQIDIRYEKGLLIVRGQVKKEEEDRNRKFYHKASKIFSYRVTVPETADSTVEPQVVSKNGLLQVTFAKLPKTEPKKLKIKEG